MAYHLAIDIGASSGRHILGEFCGNELKTQEIYRFENYIKNENNELVWDIEHLINSVLEGIKICGEIGKIPETIAIDTWGVDYVLLDKEYNEILPAVSYRDGRTNKIPEEINKIIPDIELFSKTGIQPQNYNTIYQLFCDSKSGKMDKAEYMLLMPEYITFKLTGIIKSEYTISSTTGLLNAKSRNWDFDIISKLGFKKSLFGEIVFPGAFVGEFTKEIKDKVGFNSKICYAAAHDTASAFASCSLENDEICISSGTWSLIGVKSEKPILTNQALKANFTNEGGTDNSYRFIKNIMGMWLLQSIRRDTNKKYSYNEMMKMAQESNSFEIFNPNDQRLIAPNNMIDAIKECLGKPDLELPYIINSVYHSLASNYALALKEIEENCQIKINKIKIMGGGSKDTYLNYLTEKYSGKKIILGPSEATATGNLITQSKKTR